MTDEISYFEVASFLAEIESVDIKQFDRTETVASRAGS